LHPLLQVDENKKIIEGMAAATLRCIAFAYRTCDLHSVPVDEEQSQSWEIPEDNLTLLAIVGIKVKYFEVMANDPSNYLGPIYFIPSFCI